MDVSPGFGNGMGVSEYDSLMVTSEGDERGQKRFRDAGQLSGLGNSISTQSRPKKQIKAETGEETDQYDYDMLDQSMGQGLPSSISFFHSDTSFFQILVDSKVTEENFSFNPHSQYRRNQKMDIDSQEIYCDELGASTENSDIYFFNDYDSRFEENSLIADIEGIALMEKAICEFIFETIQRLMYNRGVGSGVWSPHEYTQILSDLTRQELDEDSYLNGITNAEYFRKTERSFNFRLKTGKNASEAVKKFFDDFTIVSHPAMMMALYHRCILKIIGVEKYNEIFNSEMFHLTINQTRLSKYSPISCLADITPISIGESQNIFGKRPLKLGEECCFGLLERCRNTYSMTLKGEYWIAIYVGNNGEGSPLFMVFGFAELLTENDIRREFVNFYNTNRQHVVLKNNSQLYESSLMVKDSNESVFGFIPDCRPRLSPEKLYILKNASDPLGTMLEWVKMRNLDS